MRAVIESAKFEKKVEKKIQCSKAERQKKSEKKCYYSSETNSSGLCIVAGVQWHHTNELTVVLSSKCKLKKNKKKKEKIQRSLKAKR